MFRHTASETERNVADDRELMTRVRDGEETALELLFARWEGQLFAFFYRLGCPPNSVEDLTEEVLVAVYRQRLRYDPGRQFAPWLYGIAHLVWKDYLRHRDREIRRATPLELAANAPSVERGPIGHAEAREEAETLRRAIQELAEPQKETLILRHYHGLSYEEIAQVLKVPLGTVKWHIHEAVRRLQASIKGARRETR